MEQEPPKIEFPCAYPLKVVGNSAEDFRDYVLDVLTRHAGPIDMDTVQEMPSRKGNFTSVRATITATGEQQLQEIFEELKSSGRVHMVI